MNRDEYNYIVCERGHPFPPLSLNDRLALAKRRGDDFILALIYEGYGSAVIKDIGMPLIAAGIRAIYEKAKTGDQEAKKDLRLQLMLWVTGTDLATIIHAMNQPTDQGSQAV